jgi:Zn-dependent protease
MPSGLQASIRLFRLAGVDVFLHWSWFLVAVFEIKSGSDRYSSVVWNVFEYLALFLIVLIHEFGHAMACRKVGGTAKTIVLWPLGGVAYVDPPQRPGATLWSIAAGPLVNVALLPVLFLALMISVRSHWAQLRPDLYNLVIAVFVIDLGLLLFNMLPIYPLDGGQILRSILWYVMGRARSLLVATVIGFLGVAALVIFAIRSGSAWYFILSIFIVVNCWAGFKHSIFLLRLAKVPRRLGFACPWCSAGPLLGAFWVCSQCQSNFDAFATDGVCPSCTNPDLLALCFDCGRHHKVSDWVPQRPLAQES